MSDALLRAVDEGVRIYDLGRPLFVGMPQSPNHPAFWHALPRRHGDVLRPDGGSAANDILVMGTHVGTHIDALSHVSQDGQLTGGTDANQAAKGGRYMDLGVHRIPPILRRGVLLDVAGALGKKILDPAYGITPEDLDIAEKALGVHIEPGDAILIRTGWGQWFDQEDGAYVGKRSGVPGVTEAGSLWLANRQPYCVGSDTIAFEQILPKQGHATLPAHRVMLVESAIYIIEALDLEELATDKALEFTFILAPLKIVGATGSPARPLAVVSRV